MNTLKKKGVLSERFLGAHSLILSEEEKEFIREKKVKNLSLSVQQLRKSSSGYA